MRKQFYVAQIIGPVFVKFALTRAGEIERAKLGMLSVHPKELLSDLYFLLVYASFQEFKVMAENLVFIINPTFSCYRKVAAQTR